MFRFLFKMNIEIEKCIYTKCYCEENVYMLCKRVNEEYPHLMDQLTVVFISNDERKVYNYSLYIA